MESETSELERLRGVPSPPASLGPQLGCEGGGALGEEYRRLSFSGANFGLTAKHKGGPNGMFKKRLSLYISVDRVTGTASTLPPDHCSLGFSLEPEKTEPSYESKLSH